MVIPKVMNRNALVRKIGGQIYPASVDLQFPPEVVKAPGASGLLALPVIRGS
jgi:hypothetical protein